MPIVTLTSDFGYKDHFVALLKGKIVIENPNVPIIDLSHEVDHFNITEAAYLIKVAYKNFPKGTIHLILVDSERNRENKHVLLQYDGHYFIAADNGILSMVLNKTEEPYQIFEINSHEAEFMSCSVDVFTNVANKIIKGIPVLELATPLEKIKETHDLGITELNGKMKGHVIYIDNFGNCVTSITKKDFERFTQGKSFEVHVGRTKLKRIHRFYSDFPESDQLKHYEGKVLVLFNQAGYLEIALYKSSPHTLGSAEKLLGLRYRDYINIVLKE